MKERYDRNRAKNVRYNVGDIVHMRVAPTPTGESTKLQCKYRGPLLITEKLHEDTYRVADLRQKEPGRRYASTAHASQLKIWRPHIEDNNTSEDESDEEYEPPDSTEDNESAQEENRDPEHTDSRESNTTQAGGKTEEKDAEEGVNGKSQPRRSRRDRRIPTHLKDYKTQLPEDE